MGVIPVGPGLNDRELKYMCFSGLDGRCCQIGYPVLFVGQKNTMPVNGGFNRHLVVYTYSHIIAFGHKKRRTRNVPIYGHGFDRLAGKIDSLKLNCQIIFSARGCGINNLNEHYQNE